MNVSRRVAIVNALFVLDEGERMAYNGADRYLVSLCRLLEELGYEPRVWQASGKTHTYEGLRIEGLPWGDEGEYGTDPVLNLQFYERTAACDKAVYFAPLLCFPRVRPRAVVISHGVFWDFPSQAWVTLTGPLKQEWLRRLHYAVTAPDLLVSVDTNTLNWVRASWPGYGSRQAYIPNFVDTELFHPSADGRGDKIVVLYPRRLDAGRGIAEAKIAARAITARHDEVEFHFVGRGTDDAIEAEMRRWAESNPGCRYYWLPMDRIPEVYRTADITLIPSKAAEGTSLSCLEAMASGNALICGRVGGLTDLVFDGYNGRLINVTPETLIQAIEDLILHPEKRRRLGQKARETAEYFSLTRWKERWARALRAVWGDRK